MKTSERLRQMIERLEERVNELEVRNLELESKVRYMDIAVSDLEYKVN